ncbi:MAG: hypothetical protein MUF13_07200, partial [Akkermansiaceae bacterium]|nr:hypothetical protein [Akkermansiaceae bacterium]
MPIDEWRGYRVKQSLHADASFQPLISLIKLIVKRLEKTSSSLEKGVDFLTFPSVKSVRISVISGKIGWDHFCHFPFWAERIGGGFTCHS